VRKNILLLFIVYCLLSALYCMPANAQDWDANYTNTVLIYEFSNTNNPTGDDSYVGTNIGVIINDPIYHPATSTTESAYYEFTGHTNHISCGSGSELNLTSIISVVTWVKPESVGSCAYVAKRTSSAASSSYLMYQNSSTDVRFSIFEEDDDLREAVASIDSNYQHWRLFSGVADGSNINLYDGVELVGSNTYDGTINDNLTTTNWIAKLRNGDDVYSYDGGVDRTTIYSTNISSSDIDTFMKHTCVGHGWIPYETNHWNEAVNTNCVLALNFEYDHPADTSNKGQNRNHGTKGAGGAAPTFVSNGTNGYYSFDGGDYIVGEDINEMDNTNALTISIWLKCKGTSDWMTAICKMEDNNNRMYIATSASGYGGTDDFIIGMANQTNSYAYSNNDYIPTNIWTFATLVYDGTGVSDSDKLKLFVNATNISLTYGAAIPSVSPNLTNSLKIGVNEDILYHWVGDIDEPRVWNYALSASDITNLYDETCVKFGKEQIGGAAETGSLFEF